MMTTQGASGAEIPLQQQQQQQEARGSECREVVVISQSTGSD